jgi:hypothetical protein
MNDPLHDAYRRLSTEAAGLYRQLGVCPMERIDPRGLAILTDLPAAEATRLASQLVDANLLIEVEHGYALDSAQRMHARTSADLDEHDEALACGVSRWLWYLLAVARAAEHLITPSHRALWPRQKVEYEAPEPPFPSDEVAALDWLDMQLPNYMAVLRFGFYTGRYQLVCDLAQRLWPLWLRRRRPEQRYEAHLLGLASSAVLKDERAYGEMLTTMAGTVRGVRPHEAYEYNRRAEQHYRGTGDALGLAQALNALGKDLLSANELDLAEARFREAEALRVEAGYERGVALSRQGRGLVALARGDATAAADHLLAAYQSLCDIDDDYDAALTQAHHAEALAVLGDLRLALVELETASLALREAGSVYGQAVALEIRARILAAAGRRGRADAASARALALYTETDPPSAERLQRCIDTGFRAGRE